MAADAAPAGPRPAPFPAVIGGLLARPAATLAEIDRQGGGVRAAGWLVILGAVCLRFEDLARAFVGWRDGSLFSPLRQSAMVLAQALRGPVVIVIVAGVVITVLAGRGRRDPGTDIELGAAAYVPGFALLAVFQVLSLPALLGPLPAGVGQVAEGLAYAWMLVLVGLSLRIARRREMRAMAAGDPAAAAAAGASAPAVSAPVEAAGTPGAAALAPRIAVTALAAVLGVGLFAGITTAARAGRTAPAFTLPRVDGPGSVSLADLRGQVVLLDFWATWCQPCEAMVKPLEELHAEFHGRGVEFVGIHSDGSGTTADEVRAHLARRGKPSPYPMVLDDGAVGGRYNVMALPHLVVLGRDGAIRKIFWGITTRHELASALSSAAN